MINQMLFDIDPDHAFCIIFTGEHDRDYAEAAADIQNVSAFDLSLGVEAVRGLDLRLGMSTAGPQLAPDSSYYNPFYNRYSAIYLDLVCDLDEVVALVAEGLATEP